MAQRALIKQCRHREASSDVEGQLIIKTAVQVNQHRAAGEADELGLEYSEISDIGQKTTYTVCQAWIDWGTLKAHADSQLYRLLQNLLGRPHNHVSAASITKSGE